MEYAITYVRRKGGLMILENKQLSLNQLNKRIDQQEKMISQLIKMIAATNKRLTYFISENTTEEKSSIIH